MGRRLSHEQKRSTISEKMYQTMLDAVTDDELQPEVRYGRVTLSKYRAVLAVLDTVRGIGWMVGILGGVIAGLLIGILDTLLRMTV